VLDGVRLFWINFGVRVTTLEVKLNALGKKQEIRWVGVCFSD
jgi:hypothetical protein